MVFLSKEKSISIDGCVAVDQIKEMTDRCAHDIMDLLKKHGTKLRVSELDNLRVFMIQYCFKGIQHMRKVHKNQEIEEKDETQSLSMTWKYFISNMKEEIFNSYREELALEYKDEVISQAWKVFSEITPESWPYFSFRNGLRDICEMILKQKQFIA